MPGILRDPVSDASSSSGHSNDGASTPATACGEYAATSFPDYNEKPLEQQLEPIAVVGMGCRLPGDVDSASEFWEMMLNKRSGQTPKVPSTRFNIDAHYHENNDRPGSFAVKGGYFLKDDLRDFDPGLFGITPIEAMWMDPQQRKLLEVVYECFESAGLGLADVSGTRTAAFVASFTADWQQMAFKEPSFRHSLAATGVDPGIISNRISHVFNLNGPSIVVNTACSSSVYATHNACNALRNNECEAAVVGGVNLVLTVDQHMNTAKLGVLSLLRALPREYETCADNWVRGAELMAYYPSFLRSIRVLDRALEDLPDAPAWTIEDLLLEDPQTSRVSEAEFSQPLCIAIQVATVQLLAAWGIEPAVTVGHSSGEIAASFAAGLISATEAIIVAYYRGKVVRDVNTNGAMMAVGLGAEDVEPYLQDVGDKIVIACHNSPLGVTLSGDAEALEAVKAKLDSDNVFARSVKTGGKAYHSHHMKPVAEKYEALVRNAKAHQAFDLPTASNAQMVSSVTDSIISANTVIDESYWSANLRSPVLFNQAVQTILTKPEFEKVDMLVEIGPHSALSGPIKQIRSALKAEKLGYLPTLLRGADSAVQLLKLAGELFLRDYPLDMDRITTVEEPLPSGKIQLTKGSFIVDLPRYQWNYTKHFWAEARLSHDHRAPKFPRHDVLGSVLMGGSLAEPTWRNMLRMRDVPWLVDHSLGGEAVFPAAGYFSMACEAVTQLNEISPNPVPVEGFVLRDVSIKNALVTPDNDTGIEVLLNLRPSVHNETNSHAQWWDFSVTSVSEEGIRNDHMTGSICMNARNRGQTPKTAPHFPQRASGRSWNQALREVGFDYGPTFQDMTDIRFDGSTYAATSRSTVKQATGTMVGESRHALHPATVDSTLQLLIVALYAGRANTMPHGFVPVQVDEIAIFVPTEKQVKEADASVYSWIDQRGIRSAVGGTQLTASDGELLLDISDMRVTSYEAAVPQHAEALKAQPYGEMVWKLDLDSLHVAERLPAFDVTKLVELAHFKNPNLKILECGWKHAASVLDKAEDVNYTITATSEAVRDQLEADYRSYKTVKAEIFDAEAGAGDDSTLKNFDLVIAPAGIASAEAVTNISKLLAPQGRMIWETDRVLPLQYLQNAGFPGVDATYNCPDKSSVSISAPIQAQDEVMTNGVSHEVQLVYRKRQTEALSYIQDAFAAIGWRATSTPIESYTVKEGAQTVMLADLEGPFLASLEQGELEALQTITNNTSSLLWVSAGGLLAGKNPEQAMASGLARSIRSEQATLDFTILDLDLETTSVHHAAQMVALTAERQSDRSFTHENEYYLSDGLLHHSRLLPETEINGRYSTEDMTPVDTPFDPSLPLVGKVQSGKIVFEHDERSEQPLQADAVEVQALFGGLNREDTLVINGSDYATNFSQEVGGVVRQVGSQVTNIKAGDHVVGYSFNKFATFQRVRADLLQVVEPAALKDSVSLLMAYGTALYGLSKLANLEADDTVLVLQGTGLSGLAAIKVAQSLGINPFVTVTDDAEAERIAHSFAVPEANIILESSADAESRLGSLKGDSGADVIFSAGHANAGFAHEAFRRMAPFGRFIDVGRKNVLKRSILDTVPLHRGGSYLSFDMLDLYKYKPQALSKLLRLTMSLFRQDSISALHPLTVKNIVELDDAVATFSDSFAANKTLIAFEKSEGHLRVMPARPSLKFDPEASYLLVGCLGGLGRSLTSWMMKKGARRFVFLSRSGADSKDAASLVQDIESAGVNTLVLKGDVTSAADVEQAVQSIPAQHPVKGVIHAAMVLRDGLFNAMTYDSWKKSTSTKVQGAINLHQALSGHELDFFIMTSSVSGTLGTPGQSNYAAANSFLDSFARHRHLRHEKATSVVLPMVLGVGVVAENVELEDALKRKGMYGIDEEHLLESFEIGIAIQDDAAAPDHLVVGLDPSKLQKSMTDAATTNAFWTEDERFGALLATMRSTSGEGAGGAQSLLSVIKGAASPAEAIGVAGEAVIGKLSGMLLVDAAEFELDGKSIADYGLDSMIGAEFRNWIFKEMALDIPFQQLLGPTLTIGKLAAQICEHHGIGGA